MNTQTMQRVCGALAVNLRIEIVRFVRKRESVTVREVADTLFGSPERMIPVRRHLQILCDAGLLQRVQIGREYTYTCAGRVSLFTAIEQMRALFGYYDNE